mgnify:CR=1 FL=1
MKKRSRRFNVKNKKSYYIRLAVGLFIVGAFLFTLASQQLRIIGIRRETAQCREEIAQRKEEYARLKEKAKYNSSDKFYEDKARDEGYVREDETVFVVGN